jgi:hypothetical protein
VSARVVVDCRCQRRRHFGLVIFSREEALLSRSGVASIAAEAQRHRTGEIGAINGLMHCSTIMSSCCVRIPSFSLDLNGSTVVIGSAGKDHEVATRGLVLAAYQLTDWSDCINDGCPRGIGHEALQWF